MEAGSEMTRASICLIALLSSYITLQVSAATFSIENKALATPGGQRLEDEFGNRALTSALQNAQTLILHEFSMSNGPKIDHITLFVEDIDGVAYTRGSTIHLSARYVAHLSPRNWYLWKREIIGVLYHEMAHIFQNIPCDYNEHHYMRGVVQGASYSIIQLPCDYNDSIYLKGVVEGVGDFIRLRSGYQSWRRQSGGQWFDGYSTTAFFFDWIDKTQISKFVNRLNQKMGQMPWTNDFFRQIAKKDVDTLWQDYQKSLALGDSNKISYITA